MSAAGRWLAAGVVGLFGQFSELATAASLRFVVRQIPTGCGLSAYQHQVRGARRETLIYICLYAAAARLRASAKSLSFSSIVNTEHPYRYR